MGREKMALNEIKTWCFVLLFKASQGIEGFEVKEKFLMVCFFPFISLCHTLFLSLLIARLLFAGD